MRRTSRLLSGAALVGSVAMAVTASQAQASPDSQWIMDRQSRCYVLYTDQQFADDVTWTGNCAGGTANGAGTATFMHGGRFVSQVTGNFTNGAATGAVRVNWSDGAHFEGDEQSGRFNGQGALTAATGDLFEGVWANGQLNGKGSVKWTNGDRYDGDWRDNRADGYGVQIWADGRKYEGAWKNDLPNGHGVLTRKDGTAFEGDFADGEPKPAAGAAGQSTPTAPAAQQQPTAPAAGPLSVASDAQAAAASAPANAQRWFDALVGLKLLAVDGSSIALSATDDGLSRQLVSANGNAETTDLTFVNARQGTVASARDKSKVVGMFRLSDVSLDIDYADGRTESLIANAGGGLSIASHSADGSSCSVWYPAGHTFSQAEREAAVAAYAHRLGLATPGAKNLTQSACAQHVAAAPAPVPAQPAAPATDSNASHHGSKSKHSARNAKTAAADQVLDPTQPIVVRSSQVHLIDVPVTATSVNAADRASHCLSVDTDGASWGFRNICGFPVQFAWCVMGGSDERNSCDGGGISGAVASNSFDALFAESNLKAEHDLRWIACEGGQSDVTPRLVRADPPAGRCVRGRAS